jgi:hypothetical protein
MEILVVSICGNYVASYGPCDVVISGKSTSTIVVFHVSFLSLSSIWDTAEFEFSQCCSFCTSCLFSWCYSLPNASSKLCLAVPTSPPIRLLFGMQKGLMAHCVHRVRTMFYFLHVFSSSTDCQVFWNPRRLRGGYTKVGVRVVCSVFINRAEFESGSMVQDLLNGK